MSRKFQDEHGKCADKIVEEPVERGVKVRHIFRAVFPAVTSFRDHSAEGEKEVVFGDGKMGEFSTHALKTLKGIQYGLSEDKYGWMMAV